MIYLNDMLFLYSSCMKQLNVSVLMHLWARPRVDTATFKVYLFDRHMPNIR